MPRYPRSVKSKNQRSRYNRRKVRGRKRYATLKRNVRNKNTVNAGLGFPKKIMMTHRYCENIDMSSATGLLQKYQFSCNGMFDPNISGTGHQPYYFDQMSALYNHYTVIGSKIKVTVAPSTSNTSGFWYGLYKDDDTTTTNVSNITTLAEQSQKTVRTIPGGTDPYFLTANWSAKKTFGGSILGNDDLQGDIASNPTEQTYYTMAIQAFGGNSVAALAMVEITYIAIWDELKQVANS